MSGGKTDSLLMAALQYVHVPRYSALILRRTFADLALPNAIMDRAQSWWIPKGVRWDSKEKRFTFPSGATVTFGYLETDADKYRYQGAEIQFCVARGTRIQLEHGRVRVEDVLVGDLVSTLEGPRRVTMVRRVGVRPCVRYVTEPGFAGLAASLTCTSDHSVLMSDGWRAYDDLLAQTPTQFRACDSTLASSGGSYAVPLPPPACSTPGREPARGPGERTPPETAPQATSASSEGAEIGGVPSCALPPASSMPPGLSCRLVLHGPLARQSGWADRTTPPRSAQGSAVLHARGASSVADSTGHCSPGSGPCGGPPRHESAGAPADTPSPGDGAARTRPFHDATLTDDRGRTPAHTHAATATYAHPYTTEPRPVSDGVDLLGCSARIFPAGEAEVWDLTVEGASHFLTSEGIVARNCGWDELTQFAENQYTYLMSRLRRLKDSSIPLRSRATANPGGLGHEWVKRRFVDPQAGSGRVFIPARLDDNPHVDRESYLESLAQLDPTTKKQLLEGIWVRDAGGLVYGHFDPELNIANELPQKRTMLDHHVLGMDPGYTDDTAFAVLGWLDGDQTVYVVECFKTKNTTPSDAAETIQRLNETYKFDRIVADVGGLGKGYAEEAKKRFHIPIEAAEKSNKRGYISLLNGALASRRLMLLRGTTDALVKEWLELPWAKGRRKDEGDRVHDESEAAGFDNHCADSVTYSWRACIAYTETAKRERPGLDTKEYYDELEAKLLESAEAKHERQLADWWEQ